MSSPTSSSEPSSLPDVVLNEAKPALSPGRFLFYFAGVLTLLVVLLMSAVTYTDPSRYFFGSRFPQIWPNSPGRKIDLFRAFSAQNKVTGLLMGSSRCTLIFPEQADRLTGLRFFNACVYNASTDHYLAMYRLFRKIQPEPPKMLILGIDAPLLTLSAVTSEDLVANYQLRSQLDSHLTRPWHYAKLYAHYLASQTFFDLGTSFRNWRSPQQPLDMYFPDGHIVRRETAAESARRLQSALTTTGLEGDVANYRAETGLADNRVENLRLLLEEAEKDGVQVVVWLTPAHPVLRAAVNRLPGVQATEQRASQVAQEMAARYHARFVDMSSPDSFGGDPSTWVDTLHPGPEDSVRELDRLLKTGDR